MVGSSSIKKNTVKSQFDFREDIDDETVKFIHREANHFENIQNTSNNISKESLEQWRNETILERRTRISSELYDQFDGIVQYGPLKGLKLADKPWWGKTDKGSMIFGVYEKEVLNFLTSNAFIDINTFIDVGAADGYYAIGLVKSSYFEQSVCFEISEKGRSTIQESAKENGVDKKVTVHGAASSEFYKALSKEMLKSSLILIDIEGGEFDVLNEKCLSAISSATIVIEIHNWVENFEDKYFQLLVNASKYFSLSFIKPVEKNIHKFEELNHLSDDSRYLLCSEGRSNAMRFLVLSPKK